MAAPKSPPPTLQLVAIFSRHESALAWARQAVVAAWGATWIESPCFDHGETTYYEASMGTGLRKQFLILQRAYDPAELAQSKLESNSWEDHLANVGDYPESRPVNIDPGYLTMTKLVLASAKDRAHRIYLSQGIYGEECLYFLDRRWQARPWTYPDYRRDDFQEFFVAARELLKKRITEDGVS